MLIQIKNDIIFVEEIAMRIIILLFVSLLLAGCGPVNNSSVPLRENEEYYLKPYTNGYVPSFYAQQPAVKSKEEYRKAPSYVKDMFEKKE